MEVRDLGVIEYEAGLRIQDEALARVLREGLGAEILLVCEHPTVITVGRALGAREDILAAGEIPVIEVSRGGRATLHLPGQVVVYPIVNLRSRGQDLHQFLRLLEEAVIETLADFRIEAQAVPEKTGVWTREMKKIASIGIAVKNGISYHGLALNVVCDLKVFSKLSPCGFNSNVMTSLMEEMSGEYKKTWALDPANLMKRVKARLAENLRDCLEDDSGT